MNCAETDATNERGELRGATSQILICLHDRKLIFPALRLNWNHVLDTLPIERNVDFVDLDLTNSLNRSAHVALKWVSRYSEENIDQAVVANLRQQSLLVVERVSADYLWRGIRYLDRSECGIGENSVQRNET